MPVPRRSLFDQGLRNVQDDLLRMGGLLDTAIAQAMQCLAERDLDLARRVVVDDAKVNAIRFKIEQDCVTLIATQQPAATDLRFLVAAMNIISDMERMADHAAGIAKIVLRMGDQPLLKPLIDMPRMADEVRGMIRSALDAYVTRDVDLARSIAKRDDVVDALYEQIFRELITFITEDPATTTRALYLMFSAHNFERIGDRAVNIAERAIFIASGEMQELNDTTAAEAKPKA
ncbi:MAG: phosphate signaling complex protein PhoU [Anaerolineales bacterium]|nr:phosphate signaling complex protein PhoU [Anaerolineales bacterium]